MRTKLAILIVVISLLLGYFFCDVVTPSAESHEPLPGRVEPSTRDLSARLHRRSLERTLRMSESTQRWLHLVALLEKAELNEMQGIADSIGVSDDQVITLVAQRWFELNPQHFFEACLSEAKRKSQGEPATFALSQFLNFLAMAWPQHDIENAAKAFARPDSEKYLETTRGRFINHLVKIDASKAIELHRAWDREFLASDGLSYLRIAAKDDPRGIAETIFTCYPTNSSPNGIYFPDGAPLINVLAKVWGEKNPTEALAFAKARQSDQGHYLHMETMKAWSMNDPSSADQWLKEQDDETQEKYRHLIVKAQAAEVQ